jgi:hypothetical protein
MMVPFALLHTMHPEVIQFQQPQSFVEILKSNTSKACLPHHDVFRKSSITSLS